MSDHFLTFDFILLLFALIEIGVQCQFEVLFWLIPMFIFHFLVITSIPSLLTSITAEI